MRRTQNGKDTRAHDETVAGAGVGAAVHLQVKGSHFRPLLHEDSRNKGVDEGDRQALDGCWRRSCFPRGTPWVGRTLSEIKSATNVGSMSRPLHTHHDRCGCCLLSS